MATLIDSLWDAGGSVMASVSTTVDSIATSAAINANQNTNTGVWDALHNGDANGSLGSAGGGWWGSGSPLFPTREAPSSNKRIWQKKKTIGEHETPAQKPETSCRSTKTLCASNIISSHMARTSDRE